MIRMFNIGEFKLETLVSRENEVATDEIERDVAKILDDVRINGDKAVQYYTEKFDGVCVTEFLVSQQEIDTAYEMQDDDFLQTLKMAAENIKEFHRHQLRSDFSVAKPDGILLGQKFTPIEKVGIYVPGGTAVYPSSVLMNAVPAELAGVSQIIMVTPPDKNGNISPVILAAAKIAGVTRIYKMGGAQAVAALAYGTKSVPKVDKIVGPGNIYVATAKRRVFGIVDIDMIAGPSEILIIADEYANPKYIAADMLSQAEHDKLAAAILITTDKTIANEVKDEIECQIPLLSRSDIARASIDNNGKIVVVNDINEAIELANTVAPEHLEVCTSDPFALLAKIKNAGSIFLGNNTPEAIGDYFAGPNHTLPTGGTARFSSPLSVDDFVKKSSYIYYSKDALEKAKRRVSGFATREGLTAHARSLEIRG